MKKLLLFLSFITFMQTTVLTAQNIELPAKLYLCESDALELDGTVINTSDTGITYQWYYSTSWVVDVIPANEIAGATNPIYSATTANNGVGQYRVVATLSDGTTTLTDQLQVVGKSTLMNYFETVPCNTFSIYDLYSYSYISGASNITFHYYESEVDANAGNANTIDNFYLYGYTTIYLRVEETSGACTEIIPLQVDSLFQPLFAGWVSNMGSCTPNSNTNTFDLTTNDTQIKNGQTWADVAYFLDFNDAWDLINPIANPSNYTALSPNQTIYARIYDTNNNGMGCDVYDSITQFQLLSAPEPTPNTTLDYIVCDASSGTANDGIGAFDLTSRNSLVLAGLSTNQFGISYHNTLADAQNNASPITSPETYTAGNEIVFTRVESSLYTECVQISQINLLVQNTCDDISICLVPYWTAPRPGFNYRNKLIVKNNGPSTVSAGSVTFTKDVQLAYNNTTGVSAGNTVVPTANGFTLSFVNLAPGESEEIDVDLTVSASANLGDMITNVAEYTTVVNDVVSENNTSTLSEIIIGSYDPNDITESHGPEIEHSTFTTDDYLYYTVRFQNVGTASAINVIIDNALDAQLDKTTFEMLSSSHSNVVERVFDKLTWQFDNINLADATDDEPNSHGYVCYRIKPLAGHSVGDIVPNTAGIIFDFNAPVITNTFDTEFVAALAVQDQYLDAQFMMMPNPANNQVNLMFDTVESSIEVAVYDMLGKLVLTHKAENVSSVPVNISSLDSGIYFVKIKYSEGQLGLKKLIKE